MVMSSAPPERGRIGDVLGGGDAFGQAPGEFHAAGGDAEQHEIVAAFVALEDFEGDAGERPIDVGRLHDKSGQEVAFLPRLTGRSLKDVRVILLRSAVENPPGIGTTGTMRV
jgi:hypothetical protein